MRIEHDNVGTPGKAAIEFLLDTKYQIIENRRLEIVTRDILLDEVDAIILKMAKKYNIKRKGKSFVFTESEMVIGYSVKEHDLETQLYDLNTRLNMLKIELARTPLQSSITLKLKGDILDLEQQIKEVKIALTKQKYFSHYDDSQSLYRRSAYTGVSEKDLTPKQSAATGAAIGGVAAGVGSASAYTHKRELSKERKNFAKLHKEKADLHKDAAWVEDQMRRAKKGSGEKVINGLIAKRDEIVNKIKQKNTKYQNSLHKLNDIQKGANQRLLKNGAKGALAGAALGLAALGAKKYKDSHKNHK